MNARTPLRSEAIVLRFTNYGESDRIVTCLTALYGKVRGMAKLAKPKSDSLIGIGGPAEDNPAQDFSSVRRQVDEIMQADIILPSLDAASQNIFERINRPHRSVRINTIVEGLQAFRKEFAGEIWLEIMLIKNMNDDPQELKRMAGIVSSLHMDRVQLNTVTRPPSEPSSMRLSDSELRNICRTFGPACEIISTFEKTADIHVDTSEASLIRETLKRRPLTLDDIVRITGMSHFDAKTRLGILEKEGLVKTAVVNDELYYVST